MATNKELLEKLEEELQSFSKNPDKMYRRWKTARNQFYNYSLRNLLIANMQLNEMKNTEVEQLASYNKWKKIGRQVRKGEKGLKILAPILVSNDVDGAEDELVGFRQTTVFDIKQTEGQELFYGEDDITGEATITLQEAIEYSILPVKIDLNTEMKKGETNYKEIRLCENITDEDNLCVLFHELAHNVLQHNTRELTSSLKEMEAESVSYIVAKHFGIDNKGSIRYIHNWNKEGIEEFDLTSANMIMKASNQIVSMMEGE